jgi:hypothetical protein
MEIKKIIKFEKVLRTFWKFNFLIMEWLKLWTCLIVRSKPYYSKDKKEISKQAFSPLVLGLEKEL